MDLLPVVECSCIWRERFHYDTYLGRVVLELTENFHYDTYMGRFVLGLTENFKGKR